MMFSSSCSKAPRAVRYMRGRETTTAAMTVACQLKTRLRSNCSRNCPMALRLPKASSRKKPTTVGGSTRGRVISASISPWPRFRRAAQQARPMPRKKVMTVAVTAVSSVMIRGLQSMVFSLLNLPAA